MPPRPAAEPAFHLTGAALWQRMDRAVEKIQQRLERTTAALEAAKIPYAIIGGNAVRAWVAQVDEAAVRTTRDVDILVQRDDFAAVKQAMASAGFTHRRVKSTDMFLDGADAKPRDAVHVLFAGEKVRDDDLVAAPGTDETLPIAAHATLTLEALVRMKLNAFWDKDRMHLRDMLEVGLIDATWPGRLRDTPGGHAMGERLQQLINDPDG